MKQFSGYIEAENKARKLAKEKVGYISMEWYKLWKDGDFDSKDPINKQIEDIYKAALSDAENLIMRHWIQRGYVKDCICSRRLMASEKVWRGLE